MTNSIKMLYLIMHMSGTSASGQMEKHGLDLLSCLKQLTG